MPIEPPADLSVISWNEEDAKEIEGGTALGWWGGFFEEGMRWKDYLAAFNTEVHPYLEAARQSAVENNIKASGNQHQYIGITPVFSDGSTFSMTFRAWGDFMAAVWSEEKNKDLSYLDFYMTVPVMKLEPLICHGVKVRWNDGSTDMIRYDTEAQARHAARRQEFDNWRSSTWATYVGRRINWRALWRRIFG